MDIEQVKNKVRHIEAVSGDYEIAHSLEDDLRCEFIAYVASLGIADVSDVAAEILKTNDFDFPRYTA